MADAGERSQAAKLRRRFESIEATALAGIVFAVVALVAQSLLLTPPRGAGQQEALLAWYADPANRWLLISGLALTTIAAVLFLWFIAVIRRRVGDREDQFFATVFLGSGILLTAILLVGTTVQASVAIGLEMRDGVAPDPGALTMLDGLAAGLLLLVLPRLEAVFIIATSTVGLRTGAFPHWLVLVGYAVGGAIFLIPLLSDPLVAVFPLWVGLMSAVLLVRTRRIERVAHR